MKKQTKKKSAKPKLPKYNPNRKPADMTIEDWQKALRAQAAQKEELAVTPVDGGKEGYFKVVNPKSTKTYSVVYRGPASSWNYCSCPDFRTNRLGTCKHLEAVNVCCDGKYSRKRYVLPDCTSVYLDYKGERRVRIRIGGERREEMLVLASRYFDSDLSLLEEKVDEFGDFISNAKQLDPEFRCFDDAFDFILQKREKKIREKICDANPNMTEGLLRVPLYPYQKQGAEFAFRQGRVVIADEMGLGKTIQAIAAAVLLKRHGLVDSVWIICPTSLKYQWKKEIEKFTDEEAEVVEGNVLARVKTLGSSPSFFKIISYHSMVNSIKHGLPVMPGLVIYDEVQRLKNWDTKMSKTMRDLKSDYVVALSGTPLENKLAELYSVMQLVDQFVLGPYWQFVNETTDKDDTGRVVGYRNLNKVGETLKPVLIRRLKKDVRLQMPARTDKNLFVTVTKEQMAVHEDCKWQVGMLLQRWRNWGFLPEKDRQRMMLLLSMMRMVADSTFILDQKSRHDTKIDEAIEIVGDIIASGDEKIVIFSQWERMQRLMAAELEAREIDFRFLHGGVPSAKRGKLIEDFMTDHDCRVFLSTDAGSTGLNLQVASIVINFDLPWNPAVLEQRIARVFRLGQQRHVQVINMVSVGTIEESMLGTIAFKTGLFEGVLDGGEDSVVLSEKKFEKLAALVEESIDEDGDTDVYSDSDESLESEIIDGTSEEIEELDEVDEVDEMDEAEETRYEEMADEDDWDGEEESQSDDDSYDEEDPLEEYDSSDDDSQNDDSKDESSDSHGQGNHKHGGRDSLNDTGTGANHSMEGGSATADGRALMSKGMEFLGGLAKALADSESRQKLVDDIVKEDPETGQVTLSIPVADKKTVSNIVSLAASLLSALGK